MLSLILLGCGSFLVILLLQFIFGTKNYVSTLPGPLSLPLVGSLLQVGIWSQKKPGISVFKDLHGKYGSIFRLKLGVLNQVVVSDYDVMKEALSSDDWSDRYLDDYIKVRSFGKPMGLIWGQGEEWKEIRRFTIKTLREFGFGKKDSMESLIQLEIQELKSDLDLLITDASGSPSSVCLKSFFVISMLNIVWSMMAGYRFERKDPKLVKIVEQSISISNKHALAANLITALPFLRHFLPVTNEWKEFSYNIQEFIRDEIKERRRIWRFLETKEDFFDVFLNEIEKRKNCSKTAEEKNYFTEEQLIMVGVDFVLGGSESSNNTLEFAILAMMLHPDVQAKVQAEIDNVVGKARSPVYADQAKMPFTEATILEIFRMANSIPQAGRAAVRETRIGQHVFPKNTYGFFNIHAWHMDEKSWENPQVFYPQRFLNNQNHVVNANKVLAFGYGKRACPGDAVAKATIFTFFTSLLQSYQFLPANPSDTRDKLWLKFLDGFSQAPIPYQVKILPRT